MLAVTLALGLLGGGTAVYAQENENETSESEAGEETAEIPESYTLEAETAETGGENGETETGEETSETTAETESSTEETDEDETISIVLESSAKTATASAGSVSINSKNVTIYGLDSWAESYISIPSGFAQTYQLKVTGASSVTYTVTSGDCVTVSSKGVISPVYETWYYYGSYWSTYKSSGYTSTKYTGNYGSAVIKVVADSTTFTVKVEFADYAEYYAEQVMQDYIDDNITSGMSTYEKVKAITAFVAENYDYSASYSSALGMIVSGGGSCWSSTYVIIQMCEMIGLEAWARNGNRDSGAGSGHINALVKDPDKSSTYYECEAGYTGTAPRAYYVKTRTSLFSYRTTSGGIEVYQYDGNETASGTLTVPSTIDGYTVVGIGEDFIYAEGWSSVSLPSTVTYIDDYAFYYCSNLTSITLPASLTSIGDSVFSGCTSLKTIKVASGNTAFSASDGVLYNKAKTTLIVYPVGKTDTSFTVPDGVKVIGAGAFSGSDNLTKIVLPDSVTTIEDNAFYYSQSLKIITLSDGITSIGDGAFYYCSALTSLILPESLEEIGQYAFAYCEALTAIVVPENVTSVGEAAFCRGGYELISFLGDAPSIGDYAFYKLSAKVYYPCGNSTWTSSIRSNTYGGESITWKKSHTLKNAVLSSSSVTGTCSECGSSVTHALTITLSTSSYTYNGSARKPTPTVIAGGNLLTKGTDYTVSYSGNTDAGTATVKITGKGSYSGTVKQTFTIKQKSIASSSSAASVSLSSSSFTYNGAAKKPTVTVKITLNSSTKTLTSGTDYTVSYSNNTDAGTATVKVTGKGNYTGSVSKTFTIKQRSINSSSTGKATVSLSSTSFTYNGAAKKPTVTAKMTLNGSTKTLTKGTDYTVTYSNNTNAGTATVKITGKGNFTGTITKTFTIKQRSINSSSTGKATATLGYTSTTYSGSARKPSVTVKMTLNSSTKTLTKGTDYTVTYSNNTSIGKATVKITGKGNFTGTITKTFTIKPKQVTISSAKSSSSKKITVKWTKLSGNVKYQIAYKKKGASSWTYKTVSASTVSKTLTGLTSGKTYYVKVRAYKTVSGTTYYGSWSSQKTVTVK